MYVQVASGIATDTVDFVRERVPIGGCNRVFEQVKDDMEAPWLQRRLLKGFDMRNVVSFCARKSSECEIGSDGIGEVGIDPAGGVVEAKS